jgi:hypothetical protein
LLLANHSQDARDGLSDRVAAIVSMFFLPNKMSRIPTY